MYMLHTIKSSRSLFPSSLEYDLFYSLLPLCVSLAQLVDSLILNKFLITAVKKVLKTFAIKKYESILTWNDSFFVGNILFLVASKIMLFSDYKKHTDKFHYKLLHYIALFLTDIV